MDKITQNALEMYNEFRVGHYSYGNKRDQYDPFLLTFLSKVEKGKNLYDVGCGSGYWLDLYVRQGVVKENIVGIDLSPVNVEDIKSRGFQAVCDNVLKLQTKDASADFTICNGVIHHTSNPFQAFKELVRITKPGGLIYLSVYNIWNPYYYIVHKATFPLRYWYWNKNPKILDAVFPAVKLLMQPFAFLIFKEFLTDQTAKTIFMDQVMTPRADLFSKKILKDYCAKTGCQVEETRYVKHHLMLAAMIRKK